jgi:hypothetical protein
MDRRKDPRLTPYLDREISGTMFNLERLVAVICKGDKNPKAPMALFVDIGYKWSLDERGHHGYVNV